MAEILGWFALTHELATHGWGVTWRLAWLPGPGSIGDQDAWLMEGLSLARVVSQATLAEEATAARAARERRDGEDRHAGR